MFTSRFIESESIVEREQGTRGCYLDRDRLACDLAFYDVPIESRKPRRLPCRSTSSPTSRCIGRADFSFADELQYPARPVRLTRRFANVTNTKSLPINRLSEREMDRTSVRVLKGIKTMKAFALILTSAVISITTGFAQTATWDGSTSNNWNVASNWTPEVVPNTTSFAVEVTNLGQTLGLTGESRVGSVNITRTTGGLFFIPFTNTTESTLSISGDFTTVASAITTFIRNSDVGMNLKVDGTMDIRNSLALGAYNFAPNNVRSAVNNVTVANTIIRSGASISLSRTTGTVSLGALQMLGGALNLTSGNSTEGTDPLVGNSITVTQLTGSTGIIQAGKDNTNGTLVVSGSTSGVFGGTISNGGGTGRVVQLTKAGTGTLTLTGSNSYTGATTVQAGTLLISGSGALNTGSAISVAGSASVLRYDAAAQLANNVTLTSGGILRYNSAANFSGSLTWTNGTLSGTNWKGNLNNLTVNAGRTISAGNSVGAATTTNQTWGGGGASTWEIENVTSGSGTGWDLLNLDGTLTLSLTEGSPFTISIVGLGVGGPAGFDAGANYLWKIVDATNSIAGFSPNLFSVNASNFGAYAGTFGIAQGGMPGIGGDDSQLYLTYTVPEPTAMALASTGLMFFFWNLRRRRSF